MLGFSPEGNDLHLFHQFLVSLGLGLLVGLQRQWAESPLGGIRTFALASLFGTVCALLSESLGVWIIAAGFFATVCFAFVGRLKQKEKVSAHTGLATELALILTFVVGNLTRTGPVWLAAALGGIVAITLQAKVELHGIAHRFNRKEIKAIMQFVLIALVLFPLVPNGQFGPYKVLNPHEIWLMVLLIVGISLSGYIIYKFFGEKAGVLLGGLLGGLISSTATTLTYARAGSGSGAVVIAIAWATMYPRMMLEVAVAAQNFRSAWMPLGSLFLVSAAAAFWVWKRRPAKHTGMLVQNNPTEMKTALSFAAVYAFLLVGVAFVKEEFGRSGLRVVAVISGITDVDAITLSTSRLVNGGRLDAAEGWTILVIAVLSNLAFKGAIVGIFGGRELRKQILIPVLLPAITGIAWLVLS